MPNKLPYDYSRCSNHECSKRDNCARFRDRPFEAPWVPNNFFFEEGCTKFIEWETR